MTAPLRCRRTRRIPDNERTSGLNEVGFRSYTLKDWLAHIQRQHLRAIDLSLDRITRVWSRLGGERRGYTIVVAGTNGKGSSISMLEAVFRQGGQRTGAYTSPHLVRYNERIRICGQAVSDHEICDAFCRIESFRNDIPLTWFEYSTLCALIIFHRYRVEVALLEVGMGGRLDAVNMVHNDVVLITSIGLDHERWLGSDREKIAAEKAGVIKQNGIAVYAGSDVPASLIDIAGQKRATFIVAHRDYHFCGARQGAIDWSSDHAAVPASWQRLEQLFTPLQGDCQKANLAGVAAVLAVSSRHTRLDVADLQAGLDKCRLAARCQVIRQSPEVIVDVAHNEDSARQLAAWLQQRPCAGRTIAVLGILRDKAAERIIAAMAAVIDQWILATLGGQRGQSSQTLCGKITAVLPDAAPVCHDCPAHAWRDAICRAKARDRVVVFGSFYLVGDILAGLEGDKWL